MAWLTLLELPDDFQSPRLNICSSSIHWTPWLIGAQTHVLYLNVLKPDRLFFALNPPVWFPLSTQSIYEMSLDLEIGSLFQDKIIVSCPQICSFLKAESR